VAPIICHHAACTAIGIVGLAYATAMVRGLVEPTTLTTVSQYCGVTLFSLGIVSIGDLFVSSFGFESYGPLTFLIVGFPLQARQNLLEPCYIAAEGFAKFAHCRGLYSSRATQPQTTRSPSATQFCSS
jgi:hypothetical protein